MAFKLNPSPSFSAPVLLTVPGQDEPAQIEISFKHKMPDQLKSWMDEVNGKPVREVVPEIVDGWSLVLDDNDAEIEFTPENFKTLLANYAPAAGEIYLAYLKSLMESRVKN
jgi:hypothetical protein